MMVRGVTEEHHAVLILIGKLEAHDVGPKLCAALNVADAQHHVTDFLDFYRRIFLRHKKAPF
jgi:hypothetical protein